jgi:hypothetical protein
MTSQLLSVPGFPALPVRRQWRLRRKYRSLYMPIVTRDRKGRADVILWSNRNAFYLRRHAQRLQALGSLVEAFRAEGVTCISLKGPLLAERFYRVPFLRPSKDLDLLIHERDVSSAVRLMQKLGFRLEDGYPWNLQRHINHHLTSAQGRGSLSLAGGGTPD